MTKIRINHDSGEVYQDGTIMEASELINDYKDGLIETDPNDKELIEWFDKVGEESSIEWIADIWGMDVEFV